MLQIACETQIGNDALLKQQSGQFENILENLRGKVADFCYVQNLNKPVKQSIIKCTCERRKFLPLTRYCGQDNNSNKFPKNRSMISTSVIEV